MIKDKYLLFLIANIRNRFRKVRYFTYLDSRDIVNRIRIKEKDK